jgi:serine/threonine protein phosphatase 1
MIFAEWLTFDVPKKPRVPSGRRIYAVGDVHGRADLLSDLLMRIDDDLKARPIADSAQVFLGDYIDRGPNSRQVIDLLIVRRRQHNVLFLKGNHEECALQFLRDPTMFSGWRNMGGLSTLVSYGVVPPRRNDPQSQQLCPTVIAALFKASRCRLAVETSFSSTLARGRESPCKGNPNRISCGSATTF